MMKLGCPKAFVNISACYASVECKQEQSVGLRFHHGQNDSLFDVFGSFMEYMIGRDMKSSRLSQCNGVGLGCEIQRSRKK